MSMRAVDSHRLYENDLRVLFQQKQFRDEGRKITLWLFFLLLLNYVERGEDNADHN